MKEPTAEALYGDTPGAEEYELMPPDAWRCELLPRHYWYVPEGRQPNAFHRFTQRIFLGLKWERINE